MRQRLGFHPWGGKSPWRRAWQPTPVFLPGESHGQWSLAGYSPQGRKELDMTEATEHAHNSSNEKQVEETVPARSQTWFFSATRTPKPVPSARPVPPG